MRNIRADQIIWDTASKKWKLEFIIDRKVLPLKENVAYTTQQLMAFNFGPLDLSRDKYTKDKLTTSELNRFIELAQ